MREAVLSMDTSESLRTWVWQSLTQLRYISSQRTYTDILSSLSQFPFLSPRTDYVPGTQSVTLVLLGVSPANHHISVYIPCSYPQEPPVLFVDNGRKLLPYGASLYDAIVFDRSMHKPAPPPKVRPDLPPKQQLDRRAPPPPPPKLPNNGKSSVPSSMPTHMLSHRAGSSTPQAPALPDKVPAQEMRVDGLHITSPRPAGQPPSRPPNPHVFQPHTQSPIPAARVYPAGALENTPARASPLSPSPSPAPPVDLMNNSQLSTQQSTERQAAMQKLISGLNTCTPAIDTSLVARDANTLADLENQLSQTKQRLSARIQQQNNNIQLLERHTEAAKAIIEKADSQLLPAGWQDLVAVVDKPAEDAISADLAISDLLQFLPKALDSGSIELHMYLRLVRQYAREQFEHRYLLQMPPPKPPKK